MPPPDPDRLPPSLAAWDDLTAAADARRLENWRQDKDARREDHFVRYIVKALGLPVTYAQLRRAAEARVGDPLLTLAYLCSNLRGWPFWLGAAWAPYTYRNFVPKWYGAFTTTAVYQRYVAVKADAPDGWGGSHGVVFTMANVPKMRGAMVLHDGVVPLEEGKTVMLRRTRGVDMVVERLGDLVERMAGHVGFGD